MMLTRRRFVRQAALASVAAAAGARCLSAAPADRRAAPIAVFEKVFEALSYDELADALDQIGADGVEATIRANGHIKPEAAAEEVPKMQAALGKRGKRIVIAATDVRRADESFVAPLLKTLKSNGVLHYRLGHYYLDLDRPLKPQVAGFAKEAKEVAALNKEIGIQGLYQNHSGGRYLGGLIWDAAALLDDIDPDTLGLALDTRHLIKDTGSSWKTALAVCKPHIRSIYVKDGLWFGPRGDQYKDVPLDTGFVNAAIFREIRRGLPPLPLCIHMEWLGYRVFPKHEIPEAVKAHQRDLAALRRWLAS